MFRRGFVVLCGLALVVFGAFRVLAQDGELLGRFAPFVVDIEQAVPVVVSVPVAVNGGETVTATVPLTVNVALRVSVDGAGAQVEILDAPTPVVAVATPTATTEPYVRTPTTAAEKPDDGNRGIIFGPPVVLRQASFTTIILLVTNTTDQVKSFTAQATFKTGDQIAAVASGAVNDLLPGQTRGLSLVARGEVPEVFDSVRVNVDAMMREAGQTDKSVAAQKISFGPPAVINTGGIAMINVEVTNNDDAAHDFSLQAALTRDGKLVGYASGAVSGLAPGQVKTATLMVRGEIDDVEIDLAVESMIR